MKSPFACHTTRRTCKGPTALRPLGEQAQISNLTSEASALTRAKALLEVSRFWIQFDPRYLICQDASYQQFTGGGGHA